MSDTTTLAKVLQEAARKQPPKRTTPLAQALAEYEQPWSAPYGTPVMDNEMQQARARLEQVGKRSGLKPDDHLYNLATLQDVLAGAGQYVAAPLTGATQPFIQALGHALNYAGQVPSPVRAFGSQVERDKANAAGQTIGGDLTTLAQTLMGGVDTVSDTAGYPREYGREAAGLGAAIAVPALARGAVPYLARAGDVLAPHIGVSSAPAIRGSGPVVVGDLDMSPEARHARATEQGYTIDAYTGANRLDRLVEGIDPTRATSGPSPFFTQDPEIASKYAAGKPDNSARNELADFNDQFTLNGMKLDQIGKSLSFTQKRDLAASLENIGVDDDGNIKFLKGQPGGASVDHWRYLLKSNKGDPIAAAKELWLESGQIFGNEDQFAKVLDMAGIKGVKFDSPDLEYPGVLPAKLKIQSPFDTSNTKQLHNLLPEFEEAAKKAPQPQYVQGGVDQWDKTTTTPQAWIERYKDDLKSGTAHAWTVVPDWVTEFLKAKGFDGIKDTGGKFGGPKHVVYIPFTPAQVRSRFAAFDPKNIGKSGLSLGVVGGVALSQDDRK